MGGDLSNTGGRRAPERNPGRKHRGVKVVLFALILLFAGGALLYRDPFGWGTGGAFERLFPGPATSSREAAGTGQPPAPAPAEKGESGRRILYYVDPMNPAIRSDKPGIAPCGMDYVPVYEDAAASDEALPPGSVRVSPQKQQLIGVEVGDVTERLLKRTLRTVGRVTYDETRITHVHTKFTGYVEKVFVDFTGREVKKGQPLISIYSPELVSTQEELLIAARSRDVLGKSPVEGVAARAVSLYDSARERLRLFDISDAQIREIVKRGTPMRDLTLYATTGGYVLSKLVFEGQKVSPEMDLYTIADLSDVWVLAEVYEYEVPMVRLGQTARMTLGYEPGRVFEGAVSYIYPELDPATRTLKVRLAFRNPDLRFRPDMYVNVEFTMDYGRQLAIPQSAVLDSGETRTVFIARPDGYFVPRTVTLGARVNDFYIVKSGLQAGERVVTSANFLIDSESQLRSATGGMGGGHAGHGMGGMSGMGGMEGTGEGGGGASPGGMSHSMPGQPGASSGGMTHTMPMGQGSSMEGMDHSRQMKHGETGGAASGAMPEGHTMAPGSMGHTMPGQPGTSSGGMTHTMPTGQGSSMEGMDHSGKMKHGETGGAAPGAMPEGHTMAPGSMSHTMPGQPGASPGGMPHTMPMGQGSSMKGMDHSGTTGKPASPPGAGSP